MKVRARFRVELTGWVTVEREVPAFDVAKADDLSSVESDILNAMADDAIQDASCCLGGDVLDAEVLEVAP